MSEELENVRWYLSELSCQDADDIEGNDIDIYGEDENGVEGSFSIGITDIAQKALDIIKSLEDEIEDLTEIIEFSGVDADEILSIMREEKG